MAWLWKDHTGVAEAAEITALAKKMRPQYLAKCGGTYSSEWFWSKILHCLRTAPEVFNAAHSWVELADYVPAALTGTEAPDKFIAGVCAAGHKAMWNAEWGGYPGRGIPREARPEARRSCATGSRPRVHTIDRAVGGLTAGWAKRTGLPAGIPVAVGAFDAHLGARRLRHRTGHARQDHRHQHVRHDGRAEHAASSRTSRAFAASWTAAILPGYFGLEAGQSAVGDIFNWFVNYIQPGGKKAGSHEALTARRGEAQARRIRPARARLEQRQSHDPRGPAAHRLAPRPDALHDARGDLPRADRGDGLRRADDHQPLRGIRREDRAGRQLRRHRREEPAGDADLRGRHRPSDEDQPLGADLRARLGHRGRRGGRARTRITPRRRRR